MKRQISRLLILVGIGIWIFVAGFLYFRSLKGGSAETVAPSIGNTAPDFELANLTGQTIRLNNLRGRPVLINFWATWCGYCLQELPTIEKYYERYSSNLVVLAVEVGDSMDDVRSVVAKYGFKFPVLRDPDSHVFNRYRLDSFPVTFILNAKGVVMVRHLGFMTEDNLVNYLSEVGLNK